MLVNKMYIITDYRILFMSFLPLCACYFGNEAKYIRFFLNCHMCRLSAPMTGIFVDSSEYWRPNFTVFHLQLAYLVLKLGNVLVGVQRYHAVIVVSRGYQHGWVVLLLDVVQRRVLDQEIIVAFFLAATVLGSPEVADCELVEAKHVRHWYFADHCSK
jgi:hypothetical protein